MYSVRVDGTLLSSFEHPLNILKSEDILFDVKKEFHFYHNLGDKLHNGCQYFYGILNFFDRN